MACNARHVCHPLGYQPAGGAGVRVRGKLGAKKIVIRHAYLRFILEGVFLLISGGDFQLCKRFSSIYQAPLSHRSEIVKKKDPQCTWKLKGLKFM